MSQPSSVVACTNDPKQHWLVQAQLSRRRCPTATGAGGAATSCRAQPEGLHNIGDCFCILKVLLYTETTKACCG